jgi:folylpolyglutamate synthase/dihydropteroate synthase
LCRQFRLAVPSTWYLVPEILTAKGAKENCEGRKFFYRYPLQVLGEQILVESPLEGRHQLRNVALAIAAAVELNQQGFSGYHSEEHREGDS